MKNLGITQIRTPFRSYGVAARSWHYRRLSNRHRCPMTQRTCREDLSRSLAAFDQANTLLAVVEMGSASWLVAGMIPGVARQPKKKLDPDPEALLRLLARWRAEAVKAGRPIVRTTLAFEAGRDGFWLARWLAVRNVEPHVIHSTSVAVSREKRRANASTQKC